MSREPKHGGGSGLSLTTLLISSLATVAGLLAAVIGAGVVTASELALFGHSVVIT